MEELSARETTNGAADADDKLEVVIDAAWQEPSNQNDVIIKHRIQKVPLMFRKDENIKGEFDPKVVSIGPYHHGKEELQFVENFKPMVARLFVSGSGKDLNEFYGKVLEMVDEARSCYIEGSTNDYSDQEFANMMLLDGCFMLGLNEWYVLSSQNHEDGKSKYDDVLNHLGMLVLYSITSDVVFLLENQLPFQVLKLLVSLKFKDGQGIHMMDAFLDAHLSWDLQLHNMKEVKVVESEKQPLHALELLRRKVLLEPSGDEINQTLHNHKSQWLRKGDKLQGDIVNIKDIIHSFRSVTELKAKGIHFRPSSSNYLKSIKFSTCCFYGRLEFPPFLVTPHTKIMFSNMIAYELCPDTPTNLGITSYISFLKRLIDHPDDVKELRLKHILFNFLGGSDEEVAKVYKEIQTFGVENYEIYHNVKKSIQEHYHSKGKTWMAELIGTYFRGPWTVIAFIAATSVVALSFIQTYFTVFPRSGN